MSLWQSRWQNELVTEWDCDTESVTEWACDRVRDKMSLGQGQWQNELVTESVTEWACDRVGDRMSLWHRIGDRMSLWQSRWKNEPGTRSVTEWAGDRVGDIMSLWHRVGDRMSLWQGEPVKGWVRVSDRDPDRVCDTFCSSSGRMRRATTTWCVTSSCTTSRLSCAPPYVDSLLASHPSGRSQPTSTDTSSHIQSRHSHLMVLRHFCPVCVPVRVHLANVNSCVRFSRCSEFKILGHQIHTWFYLHSTNAESLTAPASWLENLGCLQLCMVTQGFV